MTVDVAYRNRLRTSDFTVSIIEIDIIVSARLHFSKRQAQLLGTQCVDIYKLSIVFGELTCNNVRKRVCRIKRRKHGDTEQNRVVMQANEVIDGFHIRLTSVNDIVHFAFVHKTNKFVRCRQSINDVTIKTKVGDNLRRTLRRVHSTAQIPKLLRNRYDIEFVLVVYRHIHANGTLL